MKIKSLLRKSLSYSPLALWHNKLFLFSLLCPLPKHPQCPQPLRSKDCCLILANGPSANDILPEILRRRGEFDLYTMNFAQKSEFFFQLKSKMHILADPAFFKSTVSARVEENRKCLAAAFRKIDWALQLAVPRQYLSAAKDMYAAPSVSLMGFPTRSTSLCAKYQKRIIQKGYYSFGAQSVASSALYMALMAGYKKILLAGVDADWLKTMSVDQHNKVYWFDNHHYADNPEKCYSGLSYSQEILCVARYFSELQAIHAYADTIHAEIINLYQESMVDIFPKQVFAQIVL